MKTKTKNKYILGGGVSGLIAKYYNPEYTLITPDEKLGGALTKHKNLLMTFYVHNTQQTRQLLEELKINYKEKRLRIYYIYNEKVLDYLDKDKRLKFIKNKMQDWNYDSNSIDVNDLNLSTQNNYLDILDCDINELINKLTPTSYIKGNVKLVNNNRQFFIYKDENNKLITKEYDKIISTIPANLFFPMLYNYKCNYHFNYIPATFIYSKIKPVFMEDESMYYFCDSNLPYNRCQPYNNGFVYEVSGIIKEDEISKYIKNVEAIEHRYVGVIKTEVVDDFKHIKFLGRMAQWDSSIKTQEVIDKAMRIKNE